MPDDKTSEPPESCSPRSGAGWLWLLSGPVAGLTMLLLQLKGWRRISAGAAADVPGARHRIRGVADPRGAHPTPVERRRKR